MRPYERTHRSHGFEGPRAHREKRDLASEPTDGRGVAPSFNLRPSIENLPEEHPITIEINGHPVAKLLCTPTALAELGAGWVFGQGFVERPEEIRSVNPRTERVSIMIDAPGPGGAAWQVLMAAGFDARNVMAPTLAELGLTPLEGRRTAGSWNMRPADFLSSVTSVYEAFRDERGAGGVHHAAAIDDHRMSPLMRDISRHNAVDKVVGWSLQRRVDRKRQILCISGRISADIVVKAWRAGFPAIVTRSLPTADAVELAHAARILLVGRVVDGRRSVYTHGWRLGLDMAEL
jgi:FdhD protein